MQHVGNWWQFWLWWAVGAAAFMASQEIRVGLLKVNPLRIATHTGITGPRNLQLETAVGQGSPQWEQHLVLSLSLHPSVYLLLAQGAGLGEPLLCPSTGVTAPPALAPALYPCATGYSTSLLSQSTGPATAIRTLFSSLHSHNCQDFVLAHCAAAGSTSTSARRFVLAQQR